MPQIKEDDDKERIFAIVSDGSSYSFPEIKEWGTAKELRQHMQNEGGGDSYWFGCHDMFFVEILSLKEAKELLGKSRRQK